MTAQRWPRCACPDCGPPAMMPPSQLPQFGQVRSALYALTDALDDPVTMPAVRARVLDHAAHLDEDGRQRLALLLFELADAFA